MPEEIIVDDPKDVRWMDDDPHSVGRTKKKISTPDLKKSATAKKAHKDPDSKENYRKGQDEYERSPDAKKMHRKVGRANSRRVMVNDAIKSVREGQDPDHVLEATIQERLHSRS